MSWLIAQYENLVKNLQMKHHFPWVMATGCCSHELLNSRLSTYDWQRLGVDDCVESPSQANLLFIAGWINEKQAEEIKKTYALLQRPCAVIALGSCVLSGSPYAVEGASVIKASDLVPVDVYLSGCPPRPEAILSAVLELQKKINPGPSQREVLHEALRN